MPISAIIRAAIVAIIGVILLNRTVYYADHTFFFNEIIYLFIAVGSFIAYLIIIWRDIVEFSRGRVWTSYLPTALGILIVATVLIVEYRLTLRDKSPTMLFASTPSDFNGVSLDFRADSTYKITDWCLGADIYRGKYKLEDSVITLDKNPFEPGRNVLTEKLVIHWHDSIISSEHDNEPFHISSRNTSTK